MAYVAASRARLDARIYTDSDQRLSAALARQVDKSTALEASRETPETKARRLRSFEPRQTPEPTRAERPSGTKLPAAERAARPQPEATRPPDKPPARITLDEYERQVDAQIAALRAAETRQSDTDRTATDSTGAAYQQTLRSIAEQQQGAREQLPIPARPPARPYTTTTPVDPNRPAAEMSAALVKMANENHRDLTGQDIAAPVQKFMQQIFEKAADRPPTEKQLENLEATSKALGMSEPPQMSTSLQSSLWRAHNAPDRSEILEQLTQASTTAYTAQRQQQARTIELPEPSRDIGMSID
jgi:hypothetical protein